MELKDEEKETFKTIKIAVPKFEFSKEEWNLIEDDIEFNFEKYIERLDKIIYENTECEILRKLILKQQKEIENSISKDAIKEQIKWLEHDIEKTKQNITKGNNFMTYINDYRKIRMKAFVTKSKEIKLRLEKLLEE